VFAPEDPFTAAVLVREHPIVEVLHDEAGSQKRNPFEQRLIRPVLEVLADPEPDGLDQEEGLRVVVPRRAQKAGIQKAFPVLNVGGRGERGGNIVGC
jgi:hypothetical protein